MLKIFINKQPIQLFKYTILSNSSNLPSKGAFFVDNLCQITRLNTIFKIFYIYCNTSTLSILSEAFRIVLKSLPNRHGLETLLAMVKVLSHNSNLLYLSYLAHTSVSIKSNSMDWSWINKKSFCSVSLWIVALKPLLARHHIFSFNYGTYVASAFFLCTYLCILYAEMVPILL